MDDLSTDATQAVSDVVAGSTSTTLVSSNPFDQVRAQAAKDDSVSR